MPEHSLSQETLDQIAEAVARGVWDKRGAEGSVLLEDDHYMFSTLYHLVKISEEVYAMRLTVEALLECQRALAIKDLGYDPAVIGETEWGAAIGGEQWDSTLHNEAIRRLHEYQAEARQGIQDKMTRDMDYRYKHMAPKKEGRLED